MIIKIDDDLLERICEVMEEADCPPDEPPITCDKGIDCRECWFLWFKKHEIKESVPGRSQ